METNIKHSIKFTESAYNQIINDIGSRPAESGGLLFGREEDYVVRKIVHDKHAETTKSSYTFNTDFLNPIIKKLWSEEKLSCLGFIHSHPYGFSRLSSPDVSYFRDMFSYMKRKYFITPVVFTLPDGGFKLNAYVLPYNTIEPLNANIELVPDDYYEEIKSETPVLKEKKKDIRNKIVNFYNILLDLDKVIMLIIKFIFVFGLTWYTIKILNLLTNILEILWY